MNESAKAKAAIAGAAGQFRPNLPNLTSLDRCLNRLQHCITARTDAEGLLLFAFWSTRLSSSIFDNIGKAAVAFNTTILSRHGDSHHPGLKQQPSKRVTQLKDRSKAATAIITDVRSFNRLWGTLGIIQSLKKLVVIDESSDKEELDSKKAGSFDLLVDFCQAVALIVYHITDHAIFFSKHKIIKLSSGTSAILTRWSLRSFAINTAMGVVRVLAERGRSQAVVDKNWKKNLMRTSAIFIIAVNNALPKGPLNELTLALLGVLGSGILVQGIWEKSAIAVKE